MSVFPVGTRERERQARQEGKVVFRRNMQRNIVKGETARYLAHVIKEPESAVPIPYSTLLPSPPPRHGSKQHENPQFNEAEARGTAWW
jgi:hypothetical protein